MSRDSTPSPRQEALRAVQDVRESLADPVISKDAWATLVGLAWDSRSIAGDRRETQRALRDTLLAATRDGR